MENLKNSLDLLINQRLTIILDKIAEDNSIERSSLDKYMLIDVPQVCVSEPKKPQCKALNKNGSRCASRPTAGSDFCKRHSG